MNEYDVSLIVISMIEQMIKAGVLLPGPLWTPTGTPTDEGVKERMKEIRAARDAASINEKRSERNDQK